MAAGAGIATGGLFSTGASVAASGQRAIPAPNKEMQRLEERGLQELDRVTNEQGFHSRARCSGKGAQRLSLSRLRAWEGLGYGMFIHFGMGTYFGLQWWKGDAPASTYDPDKLDVDQWVQAARDAGMKYAVLTAKHASGFCLWPSRYTGYNVANSGNKTDVVKAFILACERRGVLPSLYYGSRDNHNGPPRGCQMPTPGGKNADAYTTSLYQDFVIKQIDELLTEYGPLAEFWVDRPVLLAKAFEHTSIITSRAVSRIA